MLRLHTSIDTWLTQSNRTPLYGSRFTFSSYPAAAYVFVCMYVRLSVCLSPLSNAPITLRNQRHSVPWYVHPCKSPWRCFSRHIHVQLLQQRRTVEDRRSATTWLVVENTSKLHHWDVKMMTLNTRWQHCVHDNVPTTVEFVFYMLSTIIVRQGEVIKVSNSIRRCHLWDLVQDSINADYW